MATLPATTLTTLIKDLYPADAIDSRQPSHAASHSQLRHCARYRASASYGRWKLEGRAIKMAKQKTKSALPALAPPSPGLPRACLPAACMATPAPVPAHGPP